VRALDAATISSVTIGDRESEKTFNQQGVETSVIRTDGRSGRRAIRWFSYDLPVKAQTMVTLVADLQQRSAPGAQLRCVDRWREGRIGDAIAEQRLEVL
jgi:hypothetical protein